MNLVVDAVAQGLSLAAVLVLSSLGLTVIYGVMGVVNLAHGELMMLGAYTVALLSGAAVSPWLALAAAPVVVGLVGVALDRAVIRWLYENPVKSMLGTFALAMIIRQVVVLGVGPQQRNVPVPLTGTVPIGFGSSIAVWRLVLIVTAVAAGAVVALWLYRSSSGLRVRVTAADKDVATSLGINTTTVSATTFAVGASLAGLAGALVAPLGGANPDMGLGYLVAAFLVVVLAGLGNVRGVVVWAGIVGLTTAAISIPFDDVVAQAVVWGAALLLVTTRRTADARV